MYAKFFGLKQLPFSIAPDPRYLFMSERHREALAHLRYGATGGGGFVLLTGEIGAGKTTVCRCFLEHIPKRCNVAYVFNPQLTVIELLKTICDEFHVPVAQPDPALATVKDYLDPLNEFMLRTHAIGLSNILIIDEAQMLSAEVLEQLRLLTNLETNERKLLQIILIGQPELRDMLARPELEQLAQRVTARFHLPALSEQDTSRYIRHRLAVAGQKEQRPFDRKARRRIHQLTGGVPRKINLLCDRALLGAYAEGKSTVDAATVDRAAGEVFYKPDLAELPMRARQSRLGWVAAGVLGGALVMGGLAWAYDRYGRGLAAGTPAPAGAASSAAAASPGAPASSPAVALVNSADAAASGTATRHGIGSPTRVKDDAWRALAGLWGVDLGPGDPCGQAKLQQLQCFNRSADLNFIRQLDRPGIVTLFDDQDQPAYALLTGLGERHAVLRMGDVSQRLSLTSMAKIWRGDFATLWRSPPSYVGRIDRGQKGPVVTWLSDQLAKATGETSVPRAQSFDAVLQSRLSTFQLAQGLKPDGIAGAATLMMLNRAVGLDEPKLTVEPETPPAR